MKTLQIRNVPEDLHRKLKARAAMAGMSLSEYTLTELRRVARQPTRSEVLGRIASRPAARVRPAPVVAVQDERERQ